ncbi:MAG: DUF87 domain-containing protein [Verrucomicrobiota bacterium]
MPHKRNFGDDHRAMEMTVEDYEKLGAFYLGREYDLGAKKLEDELVLYDSKDLVTHGVVLGMTGSGKTGLCLSILEEAAMDGVPALVIDPKGDIANLLLTFPDLAPEDFRPWINEDEATKKGKTPDEFAAAQADLWKEGLGAWGQSGERIRQFRDQVDLTVYTPGSSAGVPVSILSSLDAPSFEVSDDAELLGERIESTVSSLLSLVGIDADPLQDPEHILLSNIFSHCWQAGEDVTLKSLIGFIQTPPFEEIGVLELEKFYPEKKRFGLAMKINALLASPGFGTWLKGEPLDVQRMLYTEEGKPRVSIFSIAHLGDQERMFFVSLLLNQALGWMREQSGTTSLRALLYMDEIYGYLPPTANPPSKKPMLTMLKQARAFGFGVLLATQNPVDLDYKALSNMGTWFLGRLQTERDKMRVLDGLEGAASAHDSTFDRGEMEEVLAGLGSRVFLMNNVHEDAPVIFHVRWVMSYLRGPLTRGQIKSLMADKAEAEEKREAAAGEAVTASVEEVAAVVEQAGEGVEEMERNEGVEGRGVPEGVEEYFVPARTATAAVGLVYMPGLLRVAEVEFEKASLDVFGERTVAQVLRVGSEDDVRSVDWAEAKELSPELLRGLATEPAGGGGDVRFGALPSSGLEGRVFRGLDDDFVDELYRNYRLKIWESPTYKAHSKLGEAEGDFRARLQVMAREKRDEAVGKLRVKYGKELEKVAGMIERAEKTREREESEASHSTMSSVVSIGSSVLGVLMGRKRLSVTNMKRGASATRSWGSMQRQREEAARAREKVAGLEERYRGVEAQLEEEIAGAEAKYDPLLEELEVVEIKPYKKDIKVTHCGVVWLPQVPVGG